MIKLTDDQKDRARSFLLDLCICAGIAKNTRAESYYNSYRSIFSSSSAPRLKKAAETIINAITRRTFNFGEVDSALEVFKDYRAEFGDTVNDDIPSWRVISLRLAARFLAWACQENNIYWNDMAYTSAEREDFSGSIFGAALKEAECFVSQPSRAAKAPTVVSPSAASPSAPGTAKAGPARSPYKSLGPQSGNVVGLISKPGEKESAGSSYVYCIVADKKGKNIPNAFIHPVNNPDAGERAKVSPEGLPVVKFGSGNGYTDLTIYTADRVAMYDIAEKMRSRHLFDGYENVHIACVAASSRGYYRVNTEFGEVLVKTAKLNEKLFGGAADDTEAEGDDDLEEAANQAIFDTRTFTRFSKMYD